MVCGGASDGTRCPEPRGTARCHAASRLSGAPTKAGSPVLPVRPPELEDLSAGGFLALPQDGHVVGRAGFELVAGGVGFGLFFFQLPAVAAAGGEGIEAAEEERAEQAAKRAAQVRLPGDAGFLRE